MTSTKKIVKPKADRAVKDVGVFAIRHADGDFYVKTKKEYTWSSDINDATVFKNPSIANRVIGMRAKTDDDFDKCSWFDTDDYKPAKAIKPTPAATKPTPAATKPTPAATKPTPAKEPVKPATAKSKKSKKSDRSQVIDQMQELFNKRDGINSKLELLCIELDVVEADIDATVELMTEIS